MKADRSPISTVLDPQPQLQNKLSEARTKLDGPHDPTTGRRLYNPQTGRAPYFTRHAPGQGVGEYLYNLQGEKVGARLGGIAACLVGRIFS